MKALNSIFGLAILFVISNANAADGVISVKSPLSAKATMNKFEQLAKSKGLTIFARIDHAAGAKKVNKALTQQRYLFLETQKAEHR
ncbi:hypothetical protein [Pseudoalteromonas sp. S3178]|uniref:hypothetical protein n=1 Tax=Pseudoalteromonas sp. S3178 TaxID=579532 RepID=UPI0020161E66|nr:hypothetical protein [Pseudoalteromonas sp. S3178]